MDIHLGMEKCTLPKRVVSQIGGKRFCWHKWFVLSSKGNHYTQYRECTKCGMRQIRQPDYGYQPVDMNFIMEYYGKDNC